MERGLLWLPLLGLLSWLAWAGWNEYQKLEAYRQWATRFERAKYDIYAVLGQQGGQLTWGIPTRRGPINLESLSLHQVRSLQLMVNGQPSSLDAPPQKGRTVLEFVLRDREHPIQIPFTDPILAARWCQVLQGLLKAQEQA